MLHLLLVPFLLGLVYIAVSDIGLTPEECGNGVRDNFHRLSDIATRRPKIPLWLLISSATVIGTIRLVPDDSNLGNPVLNGLSTWLESTEIPSAVTRIDGRIILSNDQLVAIMPELLAAPDLCGSSLPKLLSIICNQRPEITLSKIQEAVGKCLEGPVPQSLQCQCSNNRSIAVTVAAQMDHQGEQKLLVWSVQDSEHMQRLQQRNLHSKKMEAITRLAGGMAHEFNNLLTAVLGNLELIRSRPNEMVSQVVGNLESAEVAALRASQLIQELRRFASREAPRRETKSVVSTIKKVRRILAGMVARNIEVSHSFENESQLLAKINTSQLEEALLKLGINSAEAIGNDQVGQIHFSVGVRKCDQSTTNLLEILISDSGHGMDATIREQAFEPFFTTKESERAFGLGMAIAYGLIEEMGGSISIANTSDAGSQISVLFPLESARPGQQMTDQDSSVDESPGELLVAMVDNELSIRNVASGMLKFLGHQVELFSDGSSFLKAFQDGRKFDLVLMDNVMPGMTGRSTYEKLRSMNTEVPVIICSGRSLDLETFCPDTHTQPNAFLAKPFTMSDLATALAPFSRKT